MAITSQQLLAELDQWKAFDYYLSINNLLPTNKRLSTSNQTTISNPFLAEKQKTPSFSIFPVYGSNKWRYKDLSPSGDPKAGDIIEFVQNLYAINFREAIKKICEDFGIDNQRPHEIKTLLPQRNQVVVNDRPEQKFIDIEVLEKTITHPNMNLNPFIQAGLDIFGSDFERVMLEYFIGTSKNLQTVFWYINRNKQVCTAKAMKYGGPDATSPWEKLRRDKSSPPYFPYQTRDAYYQCFFGEHLIKPGEDVMIVESEKSAAICRIEYPGSCWIASGGSKGITIEKANGLRGLKNKFFLVSDFHEEGRTDFKKGAELLDSMNLKVQINSPFLDINDGTDLADIIIADRFARRPQA